ncbi:riboflavin biosynthesis protein RibD [Planococcus sp. PAMC 21323]|uniref:dihydrofolate reductase family protein n=1 Tax=Planococcus sp. PAMC 21323 TaxID=1526927 RepID=UPI00056E7E94|nr:dihydrofolate reductase family protein [Planococcus sp. PAMC 21323]AIY05426.1 riboflavin biosynthesis protein RibD [Planococcus sp. PAMC 21323]
MRKLILNLAISLDGFISDEYGGFDWIVGHGDSKNDTKDVFDFAEFMDSIDTIIMGSKAYEDVVLTNLDTYEDKKILVATTRELEKRDNVEFIQGDVCKVVLALKELKGKDMWLYGGGILAEPFVKADLVDEYIIGIIPTILGSGRTLFKGNNKKVDLHLDRATVVDGIGMLIYSRRLI